MNIIHKQEVSVQSAIHGARSYKVTVPSNDIDSCIQFSKFRAALCITSLLLLGSDIPRTGPGIRRLSDILTPVTPDTAFFFGPYAYSVAHIAKVANSSEYKGSADGVAISSTSVWSYKFDTVSIPQRAFVHQLDIQANWPRCILYLECCPAKELTLGVTFEMLDSLASAIQNQLFRSQAPGSTSPPWTLTVEYNWIDRVHQYLFAHLGATPHLSQVVSVHYYQLSRNSSAELEVCDPRNPNTHRPFVCDLNIPWTCRTESVKSSGASFTSSQIPLSRHLRIRIASLRRQYPLLHFDVIMISSYFVRSNSDDHKPSRWSFFRSETIEIMTIIRGRSCRSIGNQTNSECVTVFVDDYRYERASLQTDVAQWFPITGTLRCLSQSYMWLRVVALWFGCYKARSSEPKFAHASILVRTGSAWSTFFRIPGQTIVYSSWLPVIGYAFAHVVDTAVVQVNADIFGGSINGVRAYDFWTYLKAAMVQMRNIWYLAIAVKVLSLIQVHCLPKRWILRHGLICTRGIWLGWLSAFTVLGPYRLIAFRDTKVNHVSWISPDAMRPTGHVISYSEHVSDFGTRLDAKMIFVVILGTMVLVFISNRCAHKGQRLCSSLVYPSIDCPRRQRTRPVSSIRFFSRTHYLPLSVGTLFDASAMSIFWQMKLMSTSGAPLMANSPQSFNKSARSGPSSQLITCRECNSVKSQWDWSCSQGCPDHDDIYRIERRSKAVWSMVRLINLAMISDPLVWFQLRVVGRRLHLYEMTPDHGVSSAGSNRTLVLLPCDPKQLAHELEGAEVTLTLVDIVDSAFVPWSLLLQCG